MAGLLAGHAAWLSFRGGIPWSFGENFLSTVLTTGVFSSIFLGLTLALPALLGEYRPRKAIEIFASAAALGLALPMTLAVAYDVLLGALHLSSFMPFLLRRSFWWCLLAIAIAVSRALAIGTPTAGFRAFIGLIPGFLFGGMLLDLFFLPRDWNWLGSMVLGAIVGLTQSLALDLLKEAWLEEFSPRLLKRQYILETEEFVVGSEEHCDLSLPEGPEQWFQISERDGMHALEILDETQPVLVGATRFRFHILHDGDAINLGDKVFIYHNRYARARDAVPEAFS